MNPLQLLKLNRLLKEKKVSQTQLFALLESLDSSVEIKDVIDWVAQNKPSPKNTQSLETMEAIEESGDTQIAAQIEASLYEKIQEEIRQLLKINMLKNPHNVENNGETIKDYVYSKEERIEELSPTLRNLAQSFSPHMSITNTKLHPTLHTYVDMTPDTLIKTVNIPAHIMTIENVGFSKDYIKTEKKSQIFTKLYTLTNEAPSLFFKDISLLQVFAYFGLDDLIEKSIVYGADINYREKTKNKTALELYNPHPLNSLELTAYTKSLLDGSYDNGYYQALYEKKKLEQHIEEPSIDKPKRSHKI